MGLSVKLCIEYTVWVCTMVTDNKCAKKVLFLEFQVLYNAIGYHIYIYTNVQGHDTAFV